MLATFEREAWTAVEVVSVLGPLALREEHLGEVKVIVPCTDAYVGWFRELAEGCRPPMARACPSCMEGCAERLTGVLTAALSWRRARASRAT